MHPKKYGDKISLYTYSSKLQSINETSYSIAKPSKQQQKSQLKKKPCVYIKKQLKGYLKVRIKELQVQNNHDLNRSRMKKNVHQQS